MLARITVLASVSAVALVALTSSLLADIPGQVPGPNGPDFQKDVLPILQSHCVRCHGPEKQNARIRLDILSTDLVSDRAAAEIWHDVRNVLNAGEMPPKNELKLSGTQRETLIRWVTIAIKKATDAQRPSHGRVVLRRLNRVEYQNTMFDLLGLDMDYARDLPPDPASADGFRNNGASLQMSSLQLEYYLMTARRALDRVIVSGPAPAVSTKEFTEGNVTRWLGGTERSSRLQRKQAFLATILEDYPEQGEFRVRVTLTAELKPDVGFPILELSVGYRPDTQILFRSAGVVEITSADEQVHEFRGRLENHPLPVRGQGKFPGLVIMARNIYDNNSPYPKIGGGKNKQKPTFPDEPDLPTIIIQSVDFEAPVFDNWPPPLHRSILFDSELLEKDERAYVAAVLKRFMSKAYRRPIKQNEVDRMVDFFTSIRSEFPSFEETIRETLAMVLIRPDFLYIMEPSGEDRRTIGDWELASRLSYFVWSTMPDQRLRELAAAGTLHKPDVLTREVERLLRDPRSANFTDQFSDQWLELDGIEGIAVSRDHYPDFDDTLKVDMRRETQQFFAELLRHNLSVSNLLESDFTMLNEPLARHYGIAGVLGHEYRRVSLEPKHNRGGVLGHAGVLMSNSTGSDSHAVRRAVWIRDRLLNDPPSPPPPNVPSLDEEDAEFLKLSVREQLEIHRGTEACAECHRGIDPWGIALENFDAVGLWRDEVRQKVGTRFQNKPVNATDILPSGHTLNGIAGLKEFLLTKRKGQFTRALVSRLLAYALGRRLELTDEDAIDALIEKFSHNDCRLRSLVIGIASSRPFQTK